MLGGNKTRQGRLEVLTAIASMGLLRLSYRFILLPSLVSATCFACRSHPRTLTSPLSSSEQNVQPSALSSQNTQTIVPVQQTGLKRAKAKVPSTKANKEPNISLAYGEGINLAASAYQLSQSAVSLDDWGLIKSRWQQAIDKLESLSPSDENYATAQRKIADYQRSKTQAQAQIETLQNPTYVPLSSNRRISTIPSKELQQTAAKTDYLPSGSGQSSNTTVPIVYRLHGTPVVRVTFNGTQTYDMILDTGASRTLITRQMANELAVVPTERMLASTASEAEVSFDIGRVRSIEMGGILLSNSRVSIGDTVEIGLLGNDFLQGYDVTIRAGQGLVELVSAN